jgi:hypothetical protein
MSSENDNAALTSELKTRCTEEMADKFNSAAADEGRTPSNLLRLVIDEYLKARESSD